MFDVTDHDPSETAGQVSWFRGLVQKLFIRGHIFLNEPFLEDPVLGRVKTMTQVAMEQVLLFSAQTQNHIYRMLPIAICIFRFSC